MLLQRLCEYADRLEEEGKLAPPMYSKARIRWLIWLDQNGVLVGDGLISTAGRGKKQNPGREYEVPHVQKTSDIRAAPLFGNAEYVLGIARDPKDKEKVDRRHRAFVELARDCAQATREPAVRAIVRFLEQSNLSQLSLPQDFKPSHKLTFRVEEQPVLPIHLPAVRDYWVFRSVNQMQSQSREMECLICGKARNIPQRLEFHITGWSRACQTKMTIISANKKAFWSYGLRRSWIAPACPMCGERFVKAANALLEDEASHVIVGALAFLFWTKEDVGFSPASLFSYPTSEEVRNLITSVLSGSKRSTAVDATAFYATSFTPSGARAAVRSWLETTVGQVKRNLVRWFKLQAMVGEWGEPEAPPLPLRGYWLERANRWVDGLAESLLPEVQGRRDVDRLAPNTAEILLRTAIKGGPLPTWLLYQAVKRNRAEQAITRPRAALVKMVLLSNQPDFPEDNTMVELDPENQNPAYLCGRLLAVLERIQQLAIPRAGSTITDRFYGTFSSAPASVAGVLLRKSQAHLSKLRKERPGHEKALQAKLEQITHPGLKTFKKTLTLQEQGLFALGYYHQRAQDRAEAIARKQEKQQTQPEAEAAE
jgi:CRISPR-associated protein Csd1